ncbi:MAG TPA: group II intron maturase-specific domain-containing protein [Gammaproteobacteria bacterium]|nr:group II intron maturase-specific domain-containing protein [Gammaproteobacteria bacterium]
MSGDVHVRIRERLGGRFPGATRLVICCRGTGVQAMEAMRVLMGRLKLTVNEDKTRRCRIPQEHFDFLGYAFGRCDSKQTGKAYIGTRPSKKSVHKVCRTISEATRRQALGQSVAEQVVALNRILVGWANYFCLGPVSPAYVVLDRHATRRLRWWLCLKHKQPGRGTSRYPDRYLHSRLGLARLSVRTRYLSWAKA